MDYGINSSSIISEINKVRTQPKLYIKKLENLMQNFEGNNLKLPNKKVKLITIEGPNAFKESIEFLNIQSSLNKLESDINLSEAANAITEQFCRTREMSSINQIDINSIIDRYGITIKGNIGISVDFGSDDLEMLIISLINDDGRKQRKNRKMMFDINYTKIGCSSKISKYHKIITVILYAVDFITGKSLNDNKSNYDYNYNSKNIGKVNYVNEYVSGLNPNIDLFTDSAKGGDNYYYKKGNYFETGNDTYNYPEGNVYKINKNDPNMKNVTKVEKNEKFVFENGKRKKIITIKKYMDNGEINTTIEKIDI